MTTITQQDLTEFLKQKKAIQFNSLCVAYKQLLVENNLPLSVDVERLTLVYKTALFDKLLSIDKGLKMKFELLRTDASKVKMIQDEIDLDGYDIIDELTEKIAELQQVYDSLYLRTAFISKSTSLSKLALSFDLDINILLQGWVFNWEGQEHVLNHFEMLLPMLVELRDTFRKTRSTSYSISNTLEALTGFFEVKNEQPTINEYSVIALAKGLKEVGAVNALKK